MNRTQSLLEAIDRYGSHNYLPLPIVLEKGKGSHVWDVEGKQYLDFLSCYSALNFGHQHPRLLDSLRQQAEKLAVCSRAFHSEELCLWSQEIVDFVGLEQVLPMNSGAEAVETAIKIARKWGREVKKVPGDPNIVTFQNNFHGRTITIVSFSSEPDYKKGFGPFTTGFKSVAYDSIADVESAIDENTVGILVEPIQAEAGIIVPTDGFLRELRDCASRRNLLLMIDEIQTGLGRTGRDFCFQHEDAQPDLLILGKSLGGGLLPISAVVGRKDVMDVIRPGQHGSTFGGNPLACAVSRVALRVLREEKLSDRSRVLGERMLKSLKEHALPKVKQIRGKGALIGIELNESSGGARRYCEELARRGVLCKETHTYVIRLAPPLTISDADLAQGLQVLQTTVRDLAA